MKNCKNIKSRQFFLLLLIISLMAVHAQADENLLVNPGFEYGNTSGWTNWGCTLRAVRDQVHSGNFSVLTSNRTQNWQGPVQSLLGTLENGKTYSISGWVRLQNASEDRIGITLSQTDSSTTQYHAINWSTGYDDQWIPLSGNFTLNATDNLTALNLYFEGPAPGVNFYLDDAQVTEFTVEQPESDATGIVDVNTVYQQLEGFGASGAWYEGWLTAHPSRNEIYDILFKQLGLDIYRLRNTYEISSDYITYSAQIVAAAESSLGHPIKIMLSSWSPPAYLKSNGSTVRGTLKKDTDGNYMYDEFARWWADSLVEFAGRGIITDYVNIQNEPDFVTDWDTCKFTPTETADSAGYNLAFEAVYQELSSRMDDMPKMLAAEACGCGVTHAYINALIDPNHAYGYAHHLYADGDYDNPDSFIPAMQNFAARYSDKPLFQTEYSRGSGEEPFSVAMDLARHMHNSLVHEGACSFFYWDLFWGGEGGLVTLDNPWQARPGYTINPTYYAFKQYSAFTDPGWYRVEASTDSSSLRISAFISPDANDLTVVVINVSDIDIDLSLSLGDFSSETSAVYRTGETEGAAYIGMFDQYLPLALPPQTITTISLTGDNSSLPAPRLEQGDL
jgi:glucuronoarabinoxylan endo-1,4-beta-xylanase